MAGEATNIASPGMPPGSGLPENTWLRTLTLLAFSPPPFFRGHSSEGNKTNENEPRHGELDTRRPPVQYLRQGGSVLVRVFKNHGKSASLVRYTDDRSSAIIEQGNFFNGGETQSTSQDSCGLIILDTDEIVENAAALLPGHADTGIPDGESNGVAIGDDIHIYGTVITIIFYGVG